MSESPPLQEDNSQHSNWMHKVSRQWWGFNFFKSRMLLRRNHLLIAEDKHPGWIPNANMRLPWQCWTHTSGRRVCLLSPSTGGRPCQWGEGQAQYFKQVILYFLFSCFKNRYHPFFLIGTICHSLSLIFTHWTVHEYLFTLPGQFHMCVCVCVCTYAHTCLHAPHKLILPLLSFLSWKMT